MESKQIIWWSPSLFCWTGGPTSLSVCPSDRSHDQHGRHRALRGCCRHLYISGDSFIFIRVPACLPIEKYKCSFLGCFLKLFAIYFWPAKVPWRSSLFFSGGCSCSSNHHEFFQLLTKHIRYQFWWFTFIRMELCPRWTGCLSRLVRSSPYLLPPPPPALGQLASLR